ncbi:DUF2860 domain-containing protein [Photobacterium lutimaris]|uniref:DUF2860 domain-containing protein n=1 Tax=Photobacterium lutimaris TaxID=388278 RepID=A0A2T3J039_9GAMM|nr:DUF2860 domain-containing protein [Photobacterium lutimaris]PSU34319.1 DUF2860 domain-containing protein [Photobacterium lutimaris]TDR75909.1 putative outer membrane protein [Photobacterium lutimaris]
MIHRYINALCFPILAFGIASNAQANQPQRWSAGFNADISLLAGYSESRSPFNTDDSTISDYGKADKESNFLVAPLGTISYTNQALDKQVYFGTSRSDLAFGRFHVELGYKHKLDNKGVLVFSYVPGLLTSETWQDPYLRNQSRAKTDSKIKGVRFQYNQILGSNFSLELSGGNQDLDEETSGSSQTTLSDAQKQSLDRQSDIYYAQLSHFMPIRRTQFLRSAISYTRNDAQGNAMASDSYGAELGVVQRVNKASFALTLSYNYIDFDEQNPIFERTQQDDKWGLFLASQYDAPMGWKNWNLVSLIGYNQSNSNIAFYDEESLLFTVGMNYRF